MNSLLEVADALIDQSGILFVLATVIVFEIPRYLFSTLALAIDALRGRRASLPAVPPAHVSIVIPVLDDAGRILDTIAKARACDLPSFEIIVVDDGSRDGTPAAIEQARLDGLVDVVITHPARAGKSAACNHGARFATGAFLLFLDSDTQVEPSGPRALLSALADPAVAAATGNLSPLNKDESLTSSVQAIEYLVSITGGRTFLEAFGANACCAGAFTMFRASVFHAIGGFNVGSGEDLEITLRLRRLGHGVKFVPSAAAEVEVPVSLPRLLAQRARWDRDSLAVRLFGYRQHRLAHRGESLSDSLMRLDFLVFEFIPTVLFPGYLVYLVSHFGADAAWILLALYVYLLGLSLVNMAITVALLPNRLSLFDAAAVLAVPVYQGVILRVARSVNFVSEALFSTSHHDDFVPAKVRRALYGEA